MWLLYGLCWSGIGWAGSDKALETVGLPAGDSMDKLTLDIVVVVSTVKVFAENGVLDGVGMSGMTASFGNKVVEFVSSVGIRAEKGCE